MVKYNLGFNNVYWHLGVSCRFAFQTGSMMTAMHHSSRAFDTM